MRDTENQYSAIRFFIHLQNQLARIIFSYLVFLDHLFKQKLFKQFEKKIFLKNDLLVFALLFFQ